MRGEAGNEQVRGRGGEGKDADKAKETWTKDIRKPKRWEGGKTQTGERKARMGNSGQVEVIETGKSASGCLEE